MNSKSGYLLFFTLLSLLVCGCNPIDKVENLSYSDARNHVDYPELPKSIKSNSLKILAWNHTISKEIESHFESTYNIDLEIERVFSITDFLNKWNEGNSSFDIIIPSHFILNDLIANKKLHLLDHANIPLIKTLGIDLGNPDLDSKLKYSVPLFYSALGICFNMEILSGIPKSWDYFVKPHENNPFLYNRVALYDDAYLTIDLLSTLLDPENDLVEEEHIASVKQFAKEMIEQNGLRFVAHDELIEELMKNESILSIIWSSDAGKVLYENPAMRFVFPEGEVLYDYNAAAIPNSSTKKGLAEFFINYILIPEVMGYLSSKNFFGNYSHLSKRFVNPLVLNCPGWESPIPSNRKYFKSRVSNLQKYKDLMKEIKSFVSEDSSKLPLPATFRNTQFDLSDYDEETKKNKTLYLLTNGDDE